ncbi:hypothetical protein M9H77_02538 [Catharanthus roseus]|uniref:Uncharacterized protein n=1 Tax=Catharanthus roseus TaxID=4058 RepID=A0ACC0C967_CATRO|nr:hypothetical protein M9H77_02538 [Catharanthus roseus]
MTAPPSFQSQRYVPPYPPKSGNSIFEEKVLSALKSLEVKTQILDSHTQSVPKLETQIGQLANAISKRDEGKLPSHPIQNPRANYHEQAKAAITLRNGKLVDNRVGEPIKDSDLNETEIDGFDMETKIENKNILPRLRTSQRFPSLKLYYHLHILERTIKWKTY